MKSYRERQAQRSIKANHYCLARGLLPISCSINFSFPAPRTREPRRLLGLGSEHPLSQKPEWRLRTGAPLPPSGATTSLGCRRPGRAPARRSQCRLLPGLVLLLGKPIRRSDRDTGALARPLPLLPPSPGHLSSPSAPSRLCLPTAWTSLVAGTAGLPLRMLWPLAPGPCCPMALTLLCSLPGLLGLEVCFRWGCIQLRGHRGEWEIGSEALHTFRPTDTGFKPHLRLLCWKLDGDLRIRPGHLTPVACHTRRADQVEG